MTDTVNLKYFHKSNKLILGVSDLDLEQMSQQNVILNTQHAHKQDVALTSFRRKNPAGIVVSISTQTEITQRDKHTKHRFSTVLRTYRIDLVTNSIITLHNHPK